MSTAPAPADPDAVLAYWESRAQLGARAGTDDLLLKKLEIAYLGQFLRPHLSLLDVGCGTGDTLRALAQSEPTLCGHGWDAAPQMLEVAQRETTRAGQSDRLSFHLCNAETLPWGTIRADLVYTERFLINLGTWERQRAVIRRLATLLCPGGSLVLVEHSQDGLDRLNALRTAVGLTTITPPWHNRYLRESEVASLDGQDGLRLEGVDHFTSTYYLLSRVVNAWQAAQAGQEPRYDAPVNGLALQLPPIGNVGQCMGWVFTRDT